jgi:hypothetical protein
MPYAAALFTAAVNTMPHLRGAAASAPRPKTNDATLPASAGD